MRKYYHIDLSDRSITSRELRGEEIVKAGRNLIAKTLLDMGAATGVQREGLEQTWPRINEQAFDSARKMMTTVHQSDSELQAYTKGATDQLLPHCTDIVDGGQRRWTNRFPQVLVDTFESQGFIWGGRWYHFDTMHFEYRPELLDPACQAPVLPLQVRKDGGG